MVFRDIEPYDDDIFEDDMRRLRPGLLNNYQAMSVHQSLLLWHERNSGVGRPKTLIKCSVFQCSILCNHNTFNLELNERLTSQQLIAIYAFRMSSFRSLIFSVISKTSK